MKKPIYLFLYFFVVMLNLVANFYEDESMEFVTKIALMPLLGVFLYQQTRSSGVLPLFALFALFFSWIGDILLLFKGEYFFIGGLLSFLLAHLSYFKAFWGTNQKIFLRQNPLLIFPFVLFGFVFLYTFQEKFGSFFIPVLVYTCVLLGMSILALGRYANSSYRGFLTVFVGSLCFVISDLSLAIYRFIQEFWGAGVWIMFTYTLAQFLIIYGLGLEIREKYEKILP